MFPPLKGTCIGVYYYRPVQCNRWCECGNCFRPFTGRKFFYFLKKLKEESVVYQKVDTNLNFVDREKQVEKFWKENHIFEKSMEDLSLIHI
mgnify:CR=1 FL=1